jgi:hypothetical protein
MTNIRTIIAAVDPYMAEDDHRVHLKVWFEELPEPVHFTADPGDCEPHGRELWIRALAGEYGTVRVLQFDKLPVEVAGMLTLERMAREARS